MKYLEYVNYDEFESAISSVFSNEISIGSNVDNANRRKMSEEKFNKLKDFNQQFKF